MQMMIEHMTARYCMHDRRVAFAKSRSVISVADKVMREFV
jgi:hypothetical protein